MRSLRLTLFSKILILVVILGLVGSGIYFGVSKGVIKKEKTPKQESSEVAKTNNTNKTEEVSATNPDEDGNVINTKKDSSDTINLSLDEWIG